MSANQQVLAASGGGKPDLVYTQLGIAASYQTGIYQVSNANFGTAASDRVIISCLTVAAPRQGLITDRIGGINATLVSTGYQTNSTNSQGNNLGRASHMHYATVPTGTSGLIKYTYSGTEEGSIGWGSINTTNSPSQIITIPVGSDGPTFTFSGINVDKGGVVVVGLGYEWATTAVYEGGAAGLTWNGSGTPSQSYGLVKSGLNQHVIHINCPTAVSNASLVISSFQNKFVVGQLAVWNP